MDRLKKFEKNNIEKVLKENFNEHATFYEMESSFLSGVYKLWYLEGWKHCDIFCQRFAP